MLYLLIKQTQTDMKQTETAKAWNRLDESDQLEAIVQGLEDCEVSEGSLFIRLYRDGSVTANIQTKADNHLTVEAVSNDTLATLFSESFEFGDDEELLEQYAETILTWMNNQK